MARSFGQAFARHLSTVPAAVVGITLGIIPVVLSVGAFAGPGYPLDGEVFSHLLPALHARASLASGELPLYTELWYTGRYQFANPMWHGFYPPAWPLFIPALPLAATAKAVIAGHLIGTVAIAYVHAERDLDWYIAAPLALLWVMPIAAHFETVHIEKLLAWPWVVLAAWQCTPQRLTRAPRRAGLVAGGAVGAAFLAGASYYVAYAALLVGVVGLAVRERAFIRGALLGGLVGLPHLLSVGAVVLGGVTRPVVHYSIRVPDVLTLLSGLYLLPGISTRWLTQGYALIGLPAVALAGCGLYYGVRHATDLERRWLLGVSVAGGLGWGLAVGWDVLYALPAVDILRVTSHATVLIAAVVLLLAGEACRQIAPYTRSRWPAVSPVALSGLLFLSVAIAGGGWIAFTGGGHTTTPADAERVATALAAGGCESAWLASTPTWGDSDDSFSSPRFAFALTRERIAVRATHYGTFGQDWVPVRDGEATFDVLLTAAPLPDRGPVKFSVADHPSPIVGSLPANAFGEARTFETADGPLYAYPVADAVRSSKRSQSASASISNGSTSPIHYRANSSRPTCGVASSTSPPVGGR